MNKLLIFLAFIITASISVYSQGNLQFNKVININLSTSDTTLTVPTNKVWKIESAGFNENMRPTNGCQIKLYLQNYFLFGSQSDLSTTTLALFSNFPIWLSTGDYQLYVRYMNCNGNSIPGVSSSVSIIEFNIVP